MQDLLHVLPVDICVPDPLRIDGDDGTFPAPIHAARRIDASTAGSSEAELLAAALEVVTHGLRAALGAALAAVLTEVGTEKDVMSVVGHCPASLPEGLCGEIERLPL
jgi:hypothetical protein